MSALAPASLPKDTVGNGTDNGDLMNAAPMPTVQIDFRRVIAALYRNRLQIFAIFLASLAVGIAWTLMTTPLYQATATVQIDSITKDIINTEDNLDSSSYDYDVDRFLQTQVDVLKSRALAQRVTDSLRLAANDNYFNRMKTQPPQVPARGKTMSETRRDMIVNMIASGLEVSVPRNSRVVEIGFISPDPELSAVIATSYANNFIAANLQRRFDSSAYARRYLEEQLSLAKDRLEAAERAQTEYARRNGLVDVRSSNQNEGPTSLTVTNLVDISAALNRARTERIAAEETYRIAAASQLLAIPEVQANSTIQQMQRERSIETAEMARDAARYRTDHPVMVQHRDRIRSIDQQITQIAGQIKQSLANQYQTALRNERQLSADVSNLRSNNQSEQGVRVQYNILSREAATNRTMYDGLLQRYKEVSASAGVASSNISLVDPAQVPNSPIRPKPLINIIVALLVGLVLSSAFVLLRDYYDDATRTPDDVINKLGVPFLGILPKLPAGMTANDVLTDPKSSVSEAFAALRTQMQLLSNEGSLNTVMITSSRESEGKSMVVFGIGRAFSRLGQKVLVIDSDLRRPSQHQLFGLTRETGLTNVLSRQSNWRDVIQKTSDPNVDFIASGPLPPSVPELLTGSAFPELLDSASQVYDLVLIDAPPVLGLADVVLLGQMVNHLIYVIESGRPLRGRGLAAIRRLKAANIKIDGAVLNKFDPKHAGYGYEYGYYYYYGRETA